MTLLSDIRPRTPDAVPQFDQELMQTLQGQILRSLRSTTDFVAVNAERLPMAFRSGAYERLTATIALLERAITTQGAETIAARGLTHRSRALRAALLRDHMMPIATIARLALANTPEVGSLRMPRGEPSVERLVAHARGMSAAAQPHAPVFVDHGLPDDFLDRLRAAAAALGASVTRRNAARGEAVGATAGIEDYLKRGRRLVRVLDAFIRSEAAGDCELLAAWSTVRSVERRRGRAAPAVEPQEQPELPITNPMRLLPASTAAEVALGEAGRDGRQAEAIPSRATA